MNIISTQYNQNNKAFEIYLSGCNGNPKCEDCHSPETWNFNNGKEWATQIDRIVKKIISFNSIIDNVWILGGEPLDQDLTELLLMISKIKVDIDKAIWLFTRYLLSEVNKGILNSVNYIKCGKYDNTLLCDDNIIYNVKLASSNQTIYKIGENINV